MDRRQLGTQGVARGRGLRHMPWMDPLTSGVNTSGLGGSVPGILFPCFILMEN